MALVYSSGKTLTEVAREIGVSPEGLRNWVNQDKADQGQGPAVLTSDEREELRRLRRENREQQQTFEVLKKSRGLLREGVDEVAVRYAFIDAERAAETNPGGHGVALLCRVLGVSRSGSYAYLATREAAREGARRQDELVTKIRHIHTASRRAYGAPRITAALRRRGHRVNHKRVERFIARARHQRHHPQTAPWPDPGGPQRDRVAGSCGTQLHGRRAGHKAGWAG